MIAKVYIEIANYNVCKWEDNYFWKEMFKWAGRTRRLALISQ